MALQVQSLRRSVLIRHWNWIARPWHPQSMGAQQICRHDLTLGRLISDKDLRTCKVVLLTPPKQRADTRRLHPRDPQPAETGGQCQRHPHHRIDRPDH